jgi:hypothetical protein
MTKDLTWRGPQAPNEVFVTLVYLDVVAHRGHSQEPLYDDVVGPTSLGVSCSVAPRACGAAARRLPRLRRAAAEAICSRRDAVPLPQREAARPPGAANGPLSASHQSWAAAEHGRTT